MATLSTVPNGVNKWNDRHTWDLNRVPESMDNASVMDNVILDNSTPHLNRVYVTHLAVLNVAPGGSLRANDIIIGEETLLNNFNGWTFVNHMDIHGTYYSNWGWSSADVVRVAPTGRITGRFFHFQADHLVNDGIIAPGPVWPTWPIAPPPPAPEPTGLIISLLLIMGAMIRRIARRNPGA